LVSALIQNSAAKRREALDAKERKAVEDRWSKEYSLRDGEAKARKKVWEQDRAIRYRKDNEALLANEIAPLSRAYDEAVEAHDDRGMKRIQNDIAEATEASDRRYIAVLKAAGLDAYIPVSAEVSQWEDKPVGGGEQPGDEQAPGGGAPGAPQTGAAAGTRSADAYNWQTAWLPFKEAMRRRALGENIDLSTVAIPADPLAPSAGAAAASTRHAGASDGQTDRAAVRNPHAAQNGGSGQNTVPAATIPAGRVAPSAAAAAAEERSRADFYEALRRLEAGENVDPRTVETLEDPFNFRSPAPPDEPGFWNWDWLLGRTPSRGD